MFIRLMSMLLLSFLPIKLCFLFKIYALIYFLLVVPFQL